MGHSGHWVCWRKLSSEWVIQANGSFEWMDHLQMGHLSEWFIHRWVIWGNGSLMNGSFEWMGVIQVNGSAERGFQVNGSFEWMGHSWMGHLWVGHLSEWVICEWVIQVYGSFKWMGHFKWIGHSWMGHSSEWIIWVNGTFEWMEVKWASKCIVVFQLEVEGIFRCFAPFTDNLLVFCKKRSMVMHTAKLRKCWIWMIDPRWLTLPVLLTRISPNFFKFICSLDKVKDDWPHHYCWPEYHWKFWS